MDSESFFWKVPWLCSQGLSYISYMWWTPRSPAFSPWHRHILSDLPRVPGQRRKLSLCVPNIRVVSCIADLWWRLSLAGLIQKSHRLGVLADCLSFQLFPYVEVHVCVCVCVFSMNTESLRRSSVFTVAQYCKASAANLPRHRSAPQPLLQAFLIYLLDF